MNKNIITIPTIELPPLRGLGTTYFQKMIKYKDAVAQTDGVTGHKQNSALVLQKSIRTAIVMRSLGLKPKDVMTICSYNHMDCLIPYYAGLFLGLVPANLDPAVPLPDCIYLLKLVKPKIILASAEALKLMEDANLNINLNAKIVVFEDIPTSHLKYSEFIVPSPEEECFTPYEVEDS